MRLSKRMAAAALTLILAFALLPGRGGVVRAQESELYASQFGVNLAYGGPAGKIYANRVAASGSSGNSGPARAVDGDPSTAWVSDGSDSAWIYLDLGATEKFRRIVVSWSGNYAAEYLLQASGDAVTWTTVAEVDNRASDDTQAARQTAEFDSYLEARFVRLQVVSRADTSAGVSLAEIEVYGPRSLAADEAARVQLASVMSGADAMLDTDSATLWRSLADDGQYVIFDLGRTAAFDNIKIRWGACFARRFEIYVSAEERNRYDDGWTLVYKTDASLGETDDVFFDRVEARYVRLELIQRETNERFKGNTSWQGGGYGSWPTLYPWEQSFEICSFDVFDWDSVPGVPVGSVMEFSKNAPAWAHMSNISLNPEGLVMAPIGYPLEAKSLTDADIVAGRGSGYESYATYNPAVIVDDNGRFHMIYRSEMPNNFDTYNGSQQSHGHMSTLSYAYSDDGVHFIRGNLNPIWTPQSDQEKWGGTEDPRIFRVRDPETGEATYYITYTMYNGYSVCEGMIKTKDFVTYESVGNFAPNVNGRNLKSGTYVVDPEGNAVLIDDPRPGKTGKVYFCIMKDGGVYGIGFTTNVERIEPEDIIIVDDAGFGANSVASVTYGNESCVAVTNIYGPDDPNIVLMYGGTDLSDGSIRNEQPNATNWFYALGLVKITKSNPFELTRIDADLVEPFLYPTDTNKIDSGLFAKCMFADTIVRHDDKWYFYYGAGDMYVGLATANASFSAAASSYEMTADGVLTASTLALNKKYGADRSAADVRYIMDVYDVNGEFITTVSADYSVRHFSETPEGEYYCGQAVSVSLDASALPSQYYAVSYLTDGQGNVLNNVSSYAVVDGEVVFG